MKKILFICWHNSARSQMAEGLLRHLGKDKFEVNSAGIEESKIRPEAIKVMAEIDINISGQTSKTVERFLDQNFDEVVTVCDSADKACPFFPNAKNRRHWDFPDPAKVEGSEEEILKAFRDSRDAIKSRIETELIK
jgi:arsenate reductase